MTRRLNFRVNDDLAAQVEAIADQMNQAGVEVSISQIARKLLEEGLQRVAARQPTSNTEKGKSFERFVAAEIQKALWDAEIELLQQRPGRRTCDVRTPHFDIECKTGKRPSTREAFSQAQAAADEGQTPIAVIRDEGSEPFVVMGFHTFLAMARAMYELQVFAEELPERLNNVE